MLQCNWGESLRREKQSGPPGSNIAGYDVGCAALPIRPFSFRSQASLSARSPRAIPALARAVESCPQRRQQEKHDGGEHESERNGSFHETKEVPRGNNQTLSERFLELRCEDHADDQGRRGKSPRRIRRPRTPAQTAMMRSKGLPRTT